MPAGLTLVWFPFAVRGTGGGTAHFFDYRGTQEITVSPENRRLIVSVYLDVGTYAPVIAVLRPSEPVESEDSEPQTEGNGGSGGSGGGGGCNTVTGILVLGIVAGMPFLKKR